MSRHMPCGSAAARRGCAPAWSAWRPRQRLGSAAEGEIGASVRGHMRVIMLIALFLVFSIGVLGAATRLSGAVIAAGSLVVESSVKRVQHPTRRNRRRACGARRQPRRRRRSAAPSRSDRGASQRCCPRQGLVGADRPPRPARSGTRRNQRHHVSADASSRPPPTTAMWTASSPASASCSSWRRAAQRGQESQLRERIGQLKEEVSGLTEQAQAKAQEIVLVNKELGGVRELYEKNLVPISKMTALERDRGAALGRARAAQRHQRADARQDLGDRAADHPARPELCAAMSPRSLPTSAPRCPSSPRKKITAAELLKRIDIRSPQAGIVQDLSVHAKGAVVGAGEQIMLIVPAADDLIVEVRLNPSDIDQVRAAPARHAALHQLQRLQHAQSSLARSRASPQPTPPRTTRRAPTIWCASRSTRARRSACATAAWSCPACRPRFLHPHRGALGALLRVQAADRPGDAARSARTDPRESKRTGPPVLRRIGPERADVSCGGSALRLRRLRRLRAIAPLRHELIELGLVLGETQPIEEVLELALLFLEPAQSLGAILVERVIAQLGRPDHAVRTAAAPVAATEGAAEALTQLAYVRQLLLPGAASCAPNGRRCDSSSSCSRM